MPHTLDSMIERVIIQFWLDGYWLVCLGVRKYLMIDIFNSLLSEKID